MPSAASYINKLRTQAEANVVKVQYPGNVAKNQNPLYASIACNPVFTVLSYQVRTCCPNVK